MNDKTSADLIRTKFKEEPDFNRAAFSIEIGCSERHVYRIIAGIETGKDPVQKTERQFSPPAAEDPDTPRIKQEYKDDSGTVIVNTYTIHSVEQLLEIADVDTENWEVDRYVTNSWGVTMKGADGKPAYRTNYQVKIWLKPKTTTNMEEAAKLLVKSIPKLKTAKYNRRTTFPDGNYAYEVAIHDAHIGQLSWRKEVLKGNYDIKIAPRKYLEVCEKLLNFVPKNAPISKIIFPVGHDYMHVENLANETFYAKNKLDADVRLPYIIDTAVNTVIKAIEMCKQVAPVEVILVPGNHDVHASFWLALLLKHLYSKDKFVMVDNGPASRKVRIWGDLLVGFCHQALGIKQLRTVNMLAQLWPKEWGESKFREWHTGHQHKKTQTKYTPITTNGGVIIRQIPSMSTIDAWHFEQAFTENVPASQAFLWDKEWGVVQSNTAHVLYEGKDE